MKKEYEILHFKTNVLLKSIIGKDLINDDNIAILELVKNAYDANSKKAIVSFKNIKANDDNKLAKSKDTYTANTSRIIVQDYGVGMDKEDIINKWLNIAYSEKKTKKQQYDRILAGAKGVGRFSCDRLGEFLNIYSRKNNGDIAHLFVDWKMFEIDNDMDLTIQSVDVKFDTIAPSDFKSTTGFEQFSSGTILEIVKLRSQWTSKEVTKGKEETWTKVKLLELKKQLEKLINPNQAYIQTKAAKENTFNIELRAEEFESEEIKLDYNDKVNGEIKNKIFEKLNFKSINIEAHIDEKGETITTLLQDKGRTIFKLVEKNNLFTNLNNAKIILYYLSPYSKAYFTRQTGIRSVDFGSVYLFINGFRIPPYGDESDDWLKLDVRKGQGYNRFIGTREIVGRIEILDPINNFKIISSREGIAKNESYQQLTDDNGFFFKTFKRLERYVVDGIGWDSIPEELKIKINEIEKRVLEDKWNPEDEIYLESDNQKFSRVYNLIHSIINAKPKDVVKLYVNEDLILQKVAEDRKIALLEFDRLIDDFSNDKIGIDALNRILEQKAKMNVSLQKQLNEFSKYTTDEITSKAILEIESLRELNLNQQESIKELVTKIEALEVANEQKEEELSIVSKQVLFQQRLLTKDLEQLLEFHHVIGISADTIDKHLINIKEDLNRGKIPTKLELIDLIESVSYESKKIISITNLATSANFNADADEMNSDLIEFVIQYIKNVRDGKIRTFNGRNMVVEIQADITEEFDYNFKPLEIAIIIDNLLSNARKAKATIIKLSFIVSSRRLQIYFSDNGLGIKEAIREKVFDFGFTTTSGSGMGLHHIKKLLSNYNGSISINNHYSEKGVEFILTFEK